MINKLYASKRLFFRLKTGQRGFQTPKGTIYVRDSLVGWIAVVLIVAFSIVAVVAKMSDSN
ncbi:hypothetical protein [Nodularia sp. NIES-3585]|uniref:hypothetical protein n=1 Tax=Nodularia sp. NIES-3585 TaxID=1973477 RepID=UPI001131CF0D|nr:hypothetical protein [Nodularia sp. NIES-3585]